MRGFFLTDAGIGNGKIFRWVGKQLAALFCLLLLAYSGWLIFDQRPGWIGSSMAFFGFQKIENKTQTIAEIKVSRAAPGNTRDRKASLQTGGRESPAPAPEPDGKRLEFKNNIDPMAASDVDRAAPPPDIREDNASTAELPGSGVGGEKTPAKDDQPNKNSAEPANPDKKTRPADDQFAGSISAMKEGAGFWLHAIAWSPDPDRRMAVVNDRIVREGDAFDGISVLRIDANEIIIQKDLEQWRLTLRAR